MLSEEFKEILQNWNLMDKTYKRDSEDEIFSFISNKNAVFYMAQEEQENLFCLSVCLKRCLKILKRDRKETEKEAYNMLENLAYLDQQVLDIKKEQIKYWKKNLRDH